IALAGECRIRCSGNANIGDVGGRIELGLLQLKPAGSGNVGVNIELVAKVADPIAQPKELTITVDGNLNAALTLSLNCDESFPALQPGPFWKETEDLKKAIDQFNAKVKLKVDWDAKANKATAIAPSAEELKKLQLS